MVHAVGRTRIALVEALMDVVVLFPQEDREVEHGPQVNQFNRRSSPTKALAATQPWHGLRVTLAQIGSLWTKFRARLTPERRLMARGYNVGILW